MGTGLIQFDTRKHVEEEIMATLREKKVSVIGICGMGGVGKTMLAKTIMKKVMDECVFDELVMIVVSQSVDIFRIQQEMAEFLGLRLKGMSISARANELRRHMNSKSILIVLDDLWNRLNLEDLGIPHQMDSKCTILLTSRNRDVFNEMNVEKIFQLKTLVAEEAWCLFKEVVGACADDPNLFSIAQEIVRECNGLPLALVTIGATLKDERNKFIWKDVLQKLSNPQDIPQFPGADLYNPIKLTYDFLESDAKSLFLLCCLFPEGDDISLTELRFYAWGLGVSKEGIISLQNGRNRVQSLVKILECHFLLLEGFNERFVKMHGTIRDVGIFIAEQEGLINHNLLQMSWAREESNNSINCAWISLFDEDKIALPEGMLFPNLRLLLINNGPHSKEFPFGYNLFERMRKLNVLSIRNCILRSHLPHQIHLLGGLRTLILESCESLKDISVVGELVSLEILYCQGCDSIKELPVEIRRLSQLKLLDISFCRNLSTIAAGILSSLTRLEELALIGSFKKWDEGKNAALCELNSLSSLTTLKIEIEDAPLSELEQIHLSSHLVEFYITIGNPTMSSFHSSTRYGREMQLLLERDFILGDWIYQLVGNTESLVLQGEGSSKLAPLVPKYGSLKRLVFQQNAKITRLSDGTSPVFPVLECLCLKGIENLEEIHIGPISSHCFKNLQEITLESLPKLQHFWNVVPNFCSLSSIYIDQCCSLRSLFPLAMWKNYVLCLKSLTIRSCSMLEHVVIWDEEARNDIGQSSPDHHPLTFSELKKLHLQDLPRLASLCKGIEFPRLEELTLVGSFKKLEGGINTTLNKLSSLTSLTTLRIESKDASLAAEQIHLPTRLKEFNVRIGSPTALFHKSTGYRRELQLVLEREITPGDWILELLMSTESLVLQGEGSSKQLVSLAPKFQSLKRLLIQNAKMTRLSDGATTVFPALESLCLKDIDDIHIGPISSHCFKNLQEIRLESLPKLQHLGNVIPHFINLSSIYIDQCCSLRSVLPRVMGNNYLLHLKSLTIRSCSMLEQVVMWEEEGGNDIVQSSPHLTFPKLEKLELHDLPRLTSLCKEIKCPLLTHLEIVKCPYLKILDSPTKNDYDSLLLFCQAEDVVDDVAISITGQKGLIESFPREKTNDSIHELVAHNITSAFPNIRFLMIDNGAEEFSFHNDLHETPRKYDLLYIGNCIFISLLSHKIHLLKNVRKLILESCVSLEDISAVGEMENLAVLSCQRCDSIKELPVEITRLSKLKLLHILDCGSLETVAAGVLSKLTGLEELTLIRSFKKWADGKNTTLSELSYLSSLTTLRIEIEDVSLAAEQIHLPNLEKFYVRIGHPSALFHKSRRYGRDMQLVLEGDFILGDWIHQLLRITESLALQGEGSSKLVSLYLPEFHSLKGLILENAKMTRLSDGRLSATSFFPELEYLGLKNIDDIEEIHNGPISSDSFMNLQEIVLVCLPKLQRLWNVVPPSLDLSSVHIAKCDSLHNLFPLAMAGNYLLRLQRIRIRSGSTLEQVVFRNEEENGQSSSRRMGKLQFLDLYDLRRFTSLYKGIDSIHFTFNSRISQPTVTQLRN